MSRTSPSLADRVAVLRDEVLATAENSVDREPPGSEVFDAVLRALAVSTETGLDLALHDAVARRLAWGDTEAKVLADAGEVCRRLLAAAQRALRDPADELQVASSVAEAASSAARIVAMLVLGRVARERSAQLREEMAQERLGQALERQREELARLEEAVARAQGRS
jgi:hypothetical protein